MRPLASCMNKSLLISLVGYWTCLSLFCCQSCLGFFSPPQSSWLSSFQTLSHHPKQLLLEQQDLPIFSVLDEITDTLNLKTNLLLEAPPGAGKTTLVPLAFLLHDNSEGRNILMVEPRRVAVRSAALRMANLLGEKVGKTVGYAIRGDSKQSKQTRITVVTDGVLLNMLQMDPSLQEYDMVILDEFHERGVGTDTALALVRQAQLLLRNDDLKMIVMSATLLGGQGSQQLLNVLGGDENCQIVTSKGRQYPIQIKWANQIDWKATPLLPLGRIQRDRKVLMDIMSRAVGQALTMQKQGDVLVFLPGAAEIKRLCQRLQQTIGTSTDSVEILPLYGALPREQQDLVIFGDSTKRRIIVSSPIAEASLTLERVTCVVDSGLRREPRCDVDTGMPRLVTTTISKASATQRAGRAGRVQQGMCIRIYNQAEFDSLHEHSPPEIVSTDLAPTLLLLASWGCASRQEILQEMPFVDPPESESLNKALQLLQELGCFKEQDEEAEDDDRLIISPHGQMVSKLPTHPRFATAIIKATNTDKIGSVTGNHYLAGAIAVAFLLDGETAGNNKISASPDLALRVQELYQSLKNMIQQKKPIKKQHPLLKYANRMSPQAHQAVQDVLSERTLLGDVLSGLGLAILPGFIDLVGERKGDASYGGSSYLLSLGRSARLDDINDVQKKYIVVVDSSTGDDGKARIRAFCSLAKQDLEAVAVEKEVLFSVPSKGHEVRAKLVRTVGSLELSGTPLPAPSANQVGRILKKVIRDSGGAYKVLIPSLSVEKRHSLESFLRRCELLVNNSEDDGTVWPSWISNFEETLDELVNPWLSSGIKSLKEIDIMSILLTELSLEQQHTLDKAFPLHIDAPDGTKIPIRYNRNQPPTARAKLQQFFGCLETPVVGIGINKNGILIKVSLELMSPSDKLLATTLDLPFFWSEAYPNVRSEMRGRYPKHPWPKDPLTAQASRQTKKQLGIEGDESTKPSRGKKKKRGKKNKR